MKRFFVFLSFLFFSINAIAGLKPKEIDSSPRDKNRFRQNDISIKAGMSLGFPLGTLVQDAKGMPKPAPSLALYFNHRFNPRWAGKAGVHYYWLKTAFETPYKDIVYIGDLPITTPEGTIYVYDTANIKYTVVKNGLFNNHYVGLPVMVEYSMRKGWRFNVGGYVAFLLKSQMTGMATEVITGDGSLLAEPVVFDESKRFNKIDYGVKTGFNYELKNRLNFGLDATIGIRDIFMKEFTAPPGDYRNMILHFDIGYRLGGSKRL
jgi:hypothetical protein